MLKLFCAMTFAPLDIAAPIEIISEVDVAVILAVAAAVVVLAAAAVFLIFRAKRKKSGGKNSGKTDDN